jgi:hypothetical protein
MKRNQTMFQRILVAFVVAPLAALVACAQTSNITIARPDADSAGIQSQVVSLLQNIPRTIRDRVFSAGCQIVIVPTVPEYTGYGYIDKPRGYLDGGGYDNADGLFIPAKNQLLIAERVSYRNSAPYKANRIPYVLLHEFGHAFDQYLGKSLSTPQWVATTLPRFLDTHTREVQKLSNTDKATLAYFCQAGGSGASETFAELFCMHCQSQSQWSSRQAALVAKFQGTDALVRQVMSNPDQVTTWAGD